MWPHDIETTVLGGLPVLVKFAAHGRRRAVPCSGFQAFERGFGFADRPASWNGPAEYAEIEYEICDRRGRYAGWIERRMTDADRRALENELWKALEWTP